MLKGIKLKATPTHAQKLVLSQWMGCARVIWNAKCEDERYMTRFARKYFPIGTYAPVDQTYSQYKNKVITPWLYDCPSQILRNSAVNWYQTYWKFIKGECGKPKRKSKGLSGSIHLTRELFRFEQCPDGNLRLFIGAKKNNIGYLNIKRHRGFTEPNSIYIKKQNGKYWVSFCHGEKSTDNHTFNKQNLNHLKMCDEDWLNKHTLGIDRGVTRPIQTNHKPYYLSENQVKNKKVHEKYIKRLQRQLSRKKKGSVRYKRAKSRLTRRHEQVGNIRNDFCHQTSRKIVNEPSVKVIVLENLNTKGMTKRPKPKPKPNLKGGWDNNQAAAKAGLNKSILDIGWHKFETYIFYKSQQAGKACFKVSAQYASQACASCGHTHPKNRKSQELFLCDNCGHTDNADVNAANNIKKRAINLIKNSGTELSKRGVLTACLDSGRGAECKSGKAKAKSAIGYESSKKKRTTTSISAVV